MQSVMDSSCGLGGLPADLNTLFSQARAAGARIHSNSWGAAVRGQYTIDSYNTDLFSWNNKDYTILFSAGNSGVDDNDNGVVDLDSLGAPGTAKNCISVGASENNRATGGYNPGGACSTWGGCWSTDFPSAPVSSDRLSNNIAGLCAFSSRGPTHDDRTKPDVVAPGSNILSTRSQGQYVSSAWGNLTGNIYYQYMGGTSMSTPLTAGAIALIRDYYNDIAGVTTPSSALLKATLVNGATEMYPGQYGTGATQEITTMRPNNAEGWGRVNLPESLTPTAPRVLDYFDFGHTISDGLQTNEWDTIVLSMSATEVFRTTLAWTDYPGTLAASGGLVNDLDLGVTAPNSTVYYPTNANQRGATQYLYYDGEPYYLGPTANTTYRYAVKFTPTSYPVNVRRGLFFVYAASYPVQYQLYVYDGIGGRPGTALYTSSLTRVAGQSWSAVKIAGVTITSGSFYVAVRPNAANLPRITTDNGPCGTANWYYNGTTWTNGCETSVYNYNIQALVSAAAYGTSHDRVNNLVGIDLNTPPQTGNYTVTVTGYNVPQGPQPYALVTTAATTFSGASAYRLFAGGNTTA